MKMFNPPHPGLVIREDVLPALASLSPMRQASSVYRAWPCRASSMAGRRSAPTWRSALRNGSAAAPKPGCARRRSMICGMPNGRSVSRSNRCNAQPQQLERNVPKIADQQSAAPQGGASAVRRSVRRLRRGDVVKACGQLGARDRANRHAVAAKFSSQLSQDWLLEQFF